MSLSDIYSRYSDQIQFLMVYIREAHPTDGWDIGSEYRTHDPTTIAERRNVAYDCEIALQYGIKTYVDEMDDAVMLAYSAWPERLYLVGVDGKICYAAGVGPWGFKPEELDEAIKEIL